MVKGITNLKYFKMKIIKFKKEHVAGIPKGAVKQVGENVADKFIADGYAEEGTQKQLDAYNVKLSKLKVNSTYEEHKAAANGSNSPCEGCGGGAEKCDDCKDDDVEVKYHVLTQEDIDANEEAAEGLEVGDEVEINEDDELVLDDDNKLIKKSEGND